MHHHAWVAYLDVYGFTNLIRTKPIPDLMDMIKQCWESIRRTIFVTEKKPYTYVFSDSIFLIFPRDDCTQGEETIEKRNSLQWCTEDVARIMEIFYEAGLPLRGGIAWDEVTHDREHGIVISNAVVRAHSYEAMVPAPLVLLPGCETIQNGYHIQEFGYPVRWIRLKKDSGMLGSLIFPRDEARFRQYVWDERKKAGLNGPYTVAAAWNTALELIDAYLQERNGTWT